MSTPASPDPATVLRALRRTRQVRQFTADPIPDDVLNDLLEVARWTGSSTNSQPWLFVVMRDPAARARVAEISRYARHVARAPLAIAVVMPGEDEISEAYDEGRVAERLLIAATAMGLGAGIGWADDPERDAIRGVLGIRAPAYVRTFVSIGYPTETALAPKSAPGAARKPLAELVRYERVE